MKMRAGHFVAAAVEIHPQLSGSRLSTRRRCGRTHLAPKPRGGERLSFAAIADRLNREAVPTRTGRPWAPETVRGIAQRGGEADRGLLPRGTRGNGTLLRGGCPAYFTV
jgi:hypothetical protein